MISRTNLGLFKEAATTTRITEPIVDSVQGNMSCICSYHHSHSTDGINSRLRNLGGLNRGRRQAIDSYRAHQLSQDRQGDLLGGPRPDVQPNRSSDRRLIFFGEIKFTEHSFTSGGAGDQANETHFGFESSLDGFDLVSPVAGDQNSNVSPDIGHFGTALNSESKAFCKQLKSMGDRAVPHNGEAWCGKSWFEKYLERST